MTVAVLHGRALSEFDTPPVEVEVHLAGGLPAFNLVGLPETEVKESRDRVRAALQNARFDFPARKITVKLAPADLPKESGRFDLPIALGILAATGQIPAESIERFLDRRSSAHSRRAGDDSESASRRRRVCVAGKQARSRPRSSATRSFIREKLARSMCSPLRTRTAAAQRFPSRSQVPTARHGRGPMCAASRMRNTRSRSPPQVDITC
jgi:Subunit ChlI of Mg-chelatase